MKITLKKNNRPAKPGFYLRAAPDLDPGSDVRPSLNQIVISGRRLDCLTPWGNLPLRKTRRNDYWSDALELELADLLAPNCPSYD